MVSSIPLEACLCYLRSLTVSSELLGCPIGIHLCLSTFPTSYTKKKGKRYLKRMLATPSEYVTCSLRALYLSLRLFSLASLSSTVSRALAWRSRSRILWSLTSLSSAVYRALAWRSRSRILWSLTSLSSAVSRALAWRSRSRLLWSLTSLSSAVAWRSRSRLLWSLTSLFSCFSSSCLSLSLAPSLKSFLLALILFTIHLECRWITNTHLELGFLSTSEMSTVLSML